MVQLLNYRARSYIGRRRAKRRVDVRLLCDPNARTEREKRASSFKELHYVIGDGTTVNNNYHSTINGTMVNKKYHSTISGTI